MTKVTLRCDRCSDCTEVEASLVSRIGLDFIFKDAQGEDIKHQNKICKRRVMVCDSCGDLIREYNSWLVGKPGDRCQCGGTFGPWEDCGGTLRLFSFLGFQDTEIKIDHKELT